MEESLLEALRAKGVLPNLVSSFVFIGLFIVLRYFANRIIAQSKSLSAETKRRWIVNVRGTLVFGSLLAIGIIWATEIREVALSLAAIAVAIVIATKEILLCLGGSFMKTASRSFSIGDRIEVDGIRGDVIDQDLLTTTVLEIGPGKQSHQQTGRAVTIPNKIFLDTRVINESFTDDYVLHVVSVPMDREHDWRQAESILLDVARKQCIAHLDPARHHFRTMTLKQGIASPSLDPRVILNFRDKDSVDLVLRICVPGKEKGKVEQAILREFLERYQAAVGTKLQDSARSLQDQTTSSA